MPSRETYRAYSLQQFTELISKMSEDCCGLSSLVKMQICHSVTENAQFHRQNVYKKFGFWSWGRFPNPSLAVA